MKDVLQYSVNCALLQQNVKKMSQTKTKLTPAEGAMLDRVLDLLMQIPSCMDCVLKLSTLYGAIGNAIGDLHTTDRDAALALRNEMQVWLRSRKDTIN